MTKLTKPQIRLTTIASILGLLQGTAWLIMALICIVEYLKSKNGNFETAPATGASYMDIFNYFVYLYFLNGNHIESREEIINPESFTFFMWVYVFSSVAWVVISALQLRSINLSGSNPLNLMKCWGVMTCLISCVDFLLVVLIAADFDNYCTSASIDEEMICTNTLIPVLVIAARGFILWIVNVMFVYVIYRIVRSVQTGKNFKRKLLSATMQLPRATLQRKQEKAQEDDVKQEPNSRY